MLLALHHSSPEWRWHEDSTRFCYNYCINTMDDQHPFIPGPWPMDGPRLGYARCRQPFLPLYQHSQVEGQQTQELVRGCILPTDRLAEQAVLLHTWDENSLRWRRLPLAWIVLLQEPDTWNLTKFLNLCQGVKAMRMRVSASGELAYRAIPSCPIGRVEDQYPDMTNKQRRERTLYHAKQIASAADRSMTMIRSTLALLVVEPFLSVFNVGRSTWNRPPPDGAPRSSAQTYLNSDKCPEHLLDFWHEVPCLDQHFICRNRERITDTMSPCHPAHVPGTEQCQLLIHIRST